MKCIDDLLLGRDFSVRSAEIFFRSFLDKEGGEDHRKLILTLLQKKGEHANELVGLVRSIQKIERRIPSAGVSYLVDGCGTGGDGTGTINISTIASIVAAGAGAYVAKHGNRSISSRSGSADLLEALGVKIDASQGLMLKALKKCGMGYFHAPLYHPLFKTFQPVRNSLGRKGVRTIFNLVGPFVNPLRPKRQLIGAFSKRLVEILSQAAEKLNYEHVLIVWSYDGLDELTTTSKTFSIELKQGRIKRNVVSPKQLCMPLGKRKELKGGNPRYNRNAAISILNGKDKGTRYEVVILNAAAILYVSGRAVDLHEGIQFAKRSIDSKAAKGVLERLIKISHDIG